MTKYSHQNAVDLFVKMVQVDSPSFSEAGMVDFIENHVKSLGWDCQIVRQRIKMTDLEEDVKERLPADELEKETEQIRITIEANQKGKDKAPVFFAAHIDTVEPGKGIKPVFTDDGKITSDGTTVLGSDDKSGVAAIIAAVDETLKADKPHGKIVLVFTALEEKGLLGARFVPIKELGVKYGFVFDTVGSVGLAVERVQHSYGVTINMEVKNIANHANGALKPNALTYACELINELPKGVINEEDFTFSQITALKTSNEPGYMVPDKAEIKGTIRSFIPEEALTLRKQYEAIIKRFQRENLTVTYKLGSLKTMGYDHSKTDIGRLMLGNAQKIFEEMGLEFKRGRTGLGGHDASVYVKEGVPTLVLSCGMQNIHTTNEWIYVDDLHNCTELIMRLIEKA